MLVPYLRKKKNVFSSSVNPSKAQMQGTNSEVEISIRQSFPRSSSQASALASISQGNDMNDEHLRGFQNY
jgi:hypothetical protein